MVPEHVKFDYAEVWTENGTVKSNKIIQIKSYSAVESKWINCIETTKV